MQSSGMERQANDDVASDDKMAVQRATSE